MNLSTLSIRRPVTTAMFFVALGLLGAISYTRLPVQLIPNYIYPKMFVVAAYPGASPEKVEEDLVERLEAEISTLDDIQEIESDAQQGFGVITVSYKLGTDLNYAYLKLQQKANSLVEELPETAFLRVERFDTSSFANYVMELSVSGSGELEWLRRVAEERVQPRLEALDGVVNVAVTGGRREAVQVILDPDRLQSYGISPLQIRARLEAFHRRREYLGEVADQGRRLFVMLEGRLTDVDQVRDLPVGAAGQPVLLRDVAEVRIEPERQEESFRVDGRPRVGIHIQKDEQSNLIRVARLVRRELEAINEDLAPSGIVVGIGFDAAGYIEKDLDRLKRLALAGAGLALLVLLMFLKRPRDVLVIFLAIPVSLLVSFNLMALAGLSIDVLTLMGLTISVGMLVDNSIVVLESVMRHRELGRGRVEAAITGSSEVLRAIAVATLTTVAVFLPLSWVKTEFTDLYADFALALVFPLLASLLVAVTLVPMLASRLPGGGAIAGPATSVGRPARKRPRRYLQLYTLLLKQAARHQVFTWSAAFLLLILTIVITTPIILYLYAEKRQPVSRIEVKVEMPRGSELEATEAVVSRLEALTQRLPDRKETRSTIREGEAFVTVELLEPEERTSGRSVASLRSELREKSEEITGATILFDQSQYSRGAGGDDDEGAAFLGLGGAREKVVLTGESTATLLDLAAEVKDVLEQIEGVAEKGVSLDVEETSPVVRLTGKRGDLSSWGLSMRQAMALLWMARREGDRLTYPFLDSEGSEMDILVRVEESGEWSLEDLRRLSIPTATGVYARLDEIMELRKESGPTRIRRHEGTRRVRVFYDYEPQAVSSQRDLEEMRGKVDAALYGMSLPRGYTLTIEREAEEENVWKFMLYVAFLLVLMILASSFESFHLPFLIIFTIPLAVIGVLLLLAITGVGFEPLVFLALLILLGIVVNNGIILIDYTQYLVRHKGFRPERAVLAAGRARLRPVMMTAGTTVLGALPMALKLGGENEIWPPFAIAVIGGLTFSTLTTLIVIPMGYLSFRAVGRWMREGLGPAGVAAGTLLAAAGLWVLYFQLHWVQGETWRLILLLPAWFAGLGTVGFVLWAARGRRRREAIAAEETLTIRVRGLKKVYGEDGPFLRGWKQQERWAVHARQRGMPPVDRGAMARELYWKVPFLGLLVYLLNFLENRFWLFVFVWVTWYFTRDLVITLMTLWRGRKQAEPRFAFSDTGWLDLAFRVSMAALAVVGTHVLGDLHLAFTLSYAGVLILAAAVLGTGRRLRSGQWQADPERRGFLPRLGLFFLRLVALIPVIGQRKEVVPALKGIDLDIEEGMLGLLGPNGAGKTTLMRIVCNIFEQSRGKASIAGRDIRKHRDAVQALVGYLPQHFGAHENFTARELLDYYALLNDIWDPGERQRLVEQVLDQVHLLERADHKLKTYSGGMKQRVGIAVALLHLPRVIVVDEPTAGLDPEERVRFRNLLAELARERVVIFSTHIVEDVTGTCDRVAVIDEGRLVFVGKVDEMRALATGKVWEVVTEEQELPDLTRRLRVVGQYPEGFDQVRVRFLAGERPSDVAAEAAEPSLEDAYLWLLGGAAPITTAPAGAVS